MKNWLRRVRGAVGMGLTWATGWVAAVFVLGALTILVPGLEIIFEAADDELLPIVLLPAFAGGVVFSVVLGIAGRRRRFDELSVGRFFGWGALGGLLLTIAPGIGAVLEGTATVGLSVMVIAGVSLLSAVSAAGSLLVARVGEDRRLLSASDEVAEIELTTEEVRHLLGGG